MATDLDTRTTTAAVIAIIAALGSFLATCAGHPIWGLILAIIAIPIGAVGLVKSASPQRTGGMLSIGSIALALLGLVVAILGLVGVIGAWLVGG